MTSLEPTFVREGEQIVAYFEKKVIASGTSFAAVEGDAVKYLESLSHERKNTASENAKKAATHIITPNGVKGEILGQFEGQWGEKEITVRFENGRIAKFQAHGGNDEGVQYVSETKQPSSFAEYFEGRLNEDVQPSIPGLTARIASLDLLIRQASAAVVQKATYAEGKELEKIILAAEAEKREAQESIEHLQAADAEAFAPPAPFEFGAGVHEQASFGRAAAGDGWLDAAVESMIEENAGLDFKSYLNEGPGQVVASLDAAIIADAGNTREVALATVIAKTAGYTGDEVESYREEFLARTEAKRREELASRTEKVKQETTEKEASVAEVPDDALFL